MPVFESYAVTYCGLWLIVATMLLQSLVGAVVKARQPGAIPGRIDPSLSHGSFVFRAHRTFHNSIENVPMMVGTVVLALLVQTGPQWTAIWVWVFAVARIIHMGLFYALSTEKNPSPRSHFYLIGVIANIALLVLIAAKLM
ncbi:MAPEG family protein [Teredinibacter purpureus]|uniref:MAPEG family protein n=1 Tax=Teredinibacter purpureus TaxID=2731756 RepID=UPI0005F86E57|nr:MAPEG family protein [Teredinibacter purpureus]